MKTTTKTETTNAKTFKVWLTNFGYESAKSPVASLDEAKEVARSACFECGIYQGENLVATFSPISGFRTYR